MKHSAETQNLIIKYARNRCNCKFSFFCILCMLCMLTLPGNCVKGGTFADMFSDLNTQIKSFWPLHQGFSSHRCSCPDCNQSYLFSLSLLLHQCLIITPTVVPTKPCGAIVELHQGDGLFAAKLCIVFNHKVMICYLKCTLILLSTFCVSVSNLQLWQQRLLTFRRSHLFGISCTVRTTRGKSKRRET